ncbi:MAG: hypothetical protein WB780_10880 [Candidatus Acidiferrales bacterium]
MPVSVDTVEEVGVFSSIGLSIQGVDRGGEERHVINVPEGAGALFVTVTAGDPGGVNRAPVNAELSMVNPQNVRVNFQPGVGGQVLFVDNNPSPGRWTFTIAYGANASVELNATTLHPSWIEHLRQLINRFGGWFGCKTCKRLVRALVVAGLIYLGGMALPVVLAHIPPALVAILSDESIRKRFLDLLRDYFNEPIDKLAERVCQLFGFCPA